MIIGVPKEIKSNENRVSITPSGVKYLSQKGHKVIVQKYAGHGSSFQDSDFVSSGAEIFTSIEDIYKQSDMIVKVKEPLPEEYDLIKKNQIVFTYFHFAASERLTSKMINSHSISIAYETVQLANGELPLLTPMSEIAGRMSVQNGAKCLEKNMGGSGKLLSGVPGVEPASVMIIGAGVVGMNAAKLAAGLGAKVYILDIDLERLRYIDDVMPSNVFTVYSNHDNIMKLLPDTDLLIGAVLVVGAKAPKIISKNMLSYMNPGSVIVDVSVDQGGCVETCKPTTHKDPVYLIDNVLHYCVANMPGAVSNTSTISLTNSTLPYVEQIATKGYKAALKDNESLLKGLNIYKDHVTHRGVAETFDLPYVDPLTIL